MNTLLLIGVNFIDVAVYIIGAIVLMFLVTYFLKILQNEKQ
jgi:hypothetical protein